ncbi:MAG: response regulator [Verrucomicrobiota bacterium]
MKRKRILVVDDEVGFTRLLKLNLEQTRAYDVLIVNWAEDAVPAATRFRPDLILLDIIMPRLVGGDVAKCLRADPSLRHIPILFFTAAVSKTRVREHDGVISGFPILAKPAGVEEIIARIDLLLSDGTQSDQNDCFSAEAAISSNPMPGPKTTLPVPNDARTALV